MYEGRTECCIQQFSATLGFYRDCFNKQERYWGHFPASLFSFRYQTQYLTTALALFL